MSDAAASTVSPRLNLSVVVAIVSDTTASQTSSAHLADCLAVLAPQVQEAGGEIIVPYYPPLEGIDRLAHRFPAVRLLPVSVLTHPPGGGSREHHDELRSHGLAVARGDLVGLLEDHARPAADWCAQVLDAHHEAYAGVGGAMENGVDHPLNWAVYFCDFGRYQNPVPEGETTRASDANVSYKRAALEVIRPVWAGSFHEPAVNAALMARGEKLALSRRVVVYQMRTDLTFGSAIRERFIWGRSYAAARSKTASSEQRLVYATLSPVLPAVLLLRMARQVSERGRLGRQFAGALPFTLPLLCAWALGELVGYLAGVGTKK